MKRVVIATAASLAIVGASAGVVLAEQPEAAGGHGTAVSAVATADAGTGPDAVQRKGELVAAVAKGHGAVVSAAAKLRGDERSAAGKARGEAARAAGAERAEAGKAKADAARAAGAERAEAGKANRP